MNQQKVWDTIAEKWAEYRKKPIPEVVEFLKNKTGKILDLGCGSGRNFVKTGGEIIGVDFSEEMLRLAKRKNKNIKLVLADFTSLPFRDNFFDCAIFIRALHCLERKRERKKALEELHRVLKPKAQAMIQVWNQKHKRLKNKKKSDYIPWTIDSKKIQRFYYLYSKKELEDELKKTGFKILSITEDKNTTAIVEK